MTTTLPADFRHADFCLPRPGEDAPRIETYRVPRYAPDGSPAGATVTVRCIECGSATYDGQRRD